MRKIFFLLLLLLAPMLFLTACSGGESSKQANLDGKTNDANVRKFGRPDFGQPEEPANIKGLVTSIVGNKVTVLKIERPGLNKDGEQVDRSTKERSTKEDNSDSKKAVLGTGTTGRVPGMGGGHGMRTGVTLDADAKEQILARMKERASGEETFLIPVGIQMLKPEENSDSGKPSMVEATLEDIKKDTMIQVWLDESVKTRQIAKFVLIIN